MRYEYRREERNDNVGKGHMIVATDVNGVENVVAFCPTQDAAESVLAAVLNGDAAAMAKMMNNPDAVAGEANGTEGGPPKG